MWFLCPIHNRSQTYSLKDFSYPKSSTCSANLNLGVFGKVNLENTFLQIKKEGDDLYVQLFDEGGFQEKNILLDVKDYDRKLLNIRLNKKIRIFN